MANNIFNKYQMHSEFAAGYAEQQMMDRETGKLELASYCQHQADLHASEARAYRDLYLGWLARSSRH